MTNESHAGLSLSVSMSPNGVCLYLSRLIQPLCRRYRTHRSYSSHRGHRSYRSHKFYRTHPIELIDPVEPIDRIDLIDAVELIDESRKIQSHTPFGDMVTLTSQREPFSYMHSYHAWAMQNSNSSLLIFMQEVIQAIRCCCY